MPRKLYQSDLTDAQWHYLQWLLPRPARTGRPRADEREVLNGILYVLHTGCRWEDMPHQIHASPKCVPGDYGSTNGGASGSTWGLS